MNRQEDDRNRVYVGTRDNRFALAIIHLNEPGAEFSCEASLEVRLTVKQARRLARKLECWAQAREAGRAISTPGTDCFVEAL